MDILFWLAPSAVVTLIAVGWVSWTGRARPAGPDRSDAAQERFAAAILREHPTAGRHPATARSRARDRSTGIAVRPSRQSVDATSDRRTA